MSLWSGGRRLDVLGQFSTVCVYKDRWKGNLLFIPWLQVFILGLQPHLVVLLVLAYMVLNC
jgi:hypothetical protein